MPDIKHKCTCFPMYYDNHDYDCDLWHDPDFQSGLSYWSPVYEELFDKATFFEYADDMLDPNELKVYASGEYDDHLGIGHFIKVWGWEGFQDARDWEDEQQSGGISWKSDEYEALGEPVEEEPFVADWFIGCDCDQSPDDAELHPTSCSLWKNEDWTNRLCEWVGDRLLWYNADDDPILTIRPFSAIDARKPEKVQSTTTSSTSTKTTSGSTWDGYGYGTWAKDRHYSEPVVFPDDTVVLASSNYKHVAGIDLPDYGLYLDSIWSPECIATLLPWRDYGLPTVRFDHAAAVIIDHFELAKQGFAVEVGCIGGHGRTGTVIACMAVLGGVPFLDAVNWTRTNYCEHAVEKPAQEWFVEWFAAHIEGRDYPPFVTQMRTSAEPEPEKPKTTTTTTKNQTKAQKKANKEAAKIAKIPAVKAEPVPMKAGLMDLFSNLREQAKARLTGRTRQYLCSNKACTFPNWEGQQYVCGDPPCYNYLITTKSPAGEKVMVDALWLADTPA